MTFPRDLVVVWERTFPRASAYDDGERTGDLYLQPVGGTLQALAVGDGSLRWTAEWNALIAAADDQIVALVPRRETWGPHSFVGLHRDTGEVAWKRALGATVRPGARDNATRTGMLRLAGRSWIQVSRLAGREGAYLCEVDLATGELAQMRRTPGSDRPLCVPEGIFASVAGKPVVWWFDGEEEHEIPVGSVSYHVAVAAGRMVTWHKSEREYRVWDLDTGAALGALAGDPYRPALDGELLVVRRGRELVAWDLAAGRERWRVVPGRKAYSNSTFLGPWVVNQEVLGNVVRRDTGEAVITDERMTAPRCFEDALLWLRGDTLYRVAVAP